MMTRWTMSYLSGPLTRQQDQAVDGTPTRSIDANQSGYMPPQQGYGMPAEQQGYGMPPQPPTGYGMPSGYPMQAQATPL
ncbi:MAG UNVERIFIED_CONTAM: hypothetical protein LVT10_23620 [Anaerolineae bacterium]|jgi:hypothetical protein